MDAPSPVSNNNNWIFQAIFEQAIDGILLADIKTRKFVMCNKSIQKMLGYDETELLSLGVDDIHPKEDLPFILKQFYKQTRSEIRTARNLPVKRKDGSIFYADIVSARISSGNREYAYGFFREITRLTDNEESFQDSYYKLEILNNISIEISSSLNTDTIFKKAVALGTHLVGGDGGSLAVYDFENDVMRYPYHYNMPEQLIFKLARKGRGLAEKAMLDGSVIVENYPADPRALEEFVEAGLEVLIAVPLASRGRNLGSLGVFGFTKDKKFTRSDVKILEAVGRQVGVAIENAMLYEKIKNDMAEISRIDKDLRISEEKFRNLVETTSDWIWEVDADMRYVYASPRIRDLLGLEPEAVIGRSPFDLMPPDEAEKIKSRISGLVNAKSPIVALTNWNRHKNGHLVLLETSAIPLFDENNNLTGYRGIDRDITEKKNLEEQLLQKQKMEAIGTLTTGITHDFNNILSMIIGNTELAANRIPENDPVRKKLEKILAASFRARDVIQRLLHFSRQTTENRKPIFPVPLVKEWLKLLKTSMPKTIELHEKFPEKSHALIADPTQIQQIVINLFTNAVHSMAETGGVLEVRIEELFLEKEAILFDPDLSPGRYIRLTVSDTGHGIDPVILKRIFDPYFTTKALDDGTGLGLSVVHGIVKSHGGGVEVISEIGRGSAFNVYLPASLDEPDHLVPIDEKLQRGTELILFIDDEKVLVELAEEMFTALGYQIECHTDPLAAVAEFSNDPGRFDLIITDMTMPKMTGDQLAEKILAIRPDIPIILCTGFNDITLAEKAKHIGIAGFIPKPVNMVTMAGTVRSVLDRKRSDI